MYKFRIASKCDRFRRAGVVFTRDGSDYYVDDLSESQWRAIADESMLAVTLLSADERAPDEPASDKPAKKVR